MHKFLGILFLTTLLSLPALAQEQPSPEWFSCTQDSDCVDISYPCAGATVNKSFAQKANEFYKLENARTNCMSTPDTGKSTVPFRTFCKANICGSEGVNPNPGFS